MTPVCVPFSGLPESSASLNYLYHLLYLSFDKSFDSHLISHLINTKLRFGTRIRVLALYSV